MHKPVDVVGTCADSGLGTGMSAADMISSVTTLEGPSTRRYLLSLSGFLQFVEVEAQPLQQLLSNGFRVCGESTLDVVYIELNS